MSRRLTFEEARRLGESLPMQRWLDPARLKPLMPRSEWEQLPRWRRLLDRLLLRDPPEDEA